MASGIAVCIISGGLDSTTLAYHYKAQGYKVVALSFDYGQRHSKELLVAKEVASRMGATFHRVDLTQVRALLHGSCLTDEAVEVPEGHYEAESMKATVVPNRNAIMLSVAWGHAIAEGAEVVAFGAHAGDHFIYPDCRPNFWAALNTALHLGSEGYGNPSLHLEAPFINMTKADIVVLGHGLGAPLSLAWSCYKGGAIHCGKCGTCVERRSAFVLAGVQDETVYED